jgi:putative NADH-flavin reductase
MTRPNVVTLLVLLFSAGASSQTTEHLDILVYGATGKVGSHVVEEALQRGHNVTAVSRDPSGIEIQHENLSVVAGDLLDLQSIELLVEDKDVIIVSVRGIIGKDK